MNYVITRRQLPVITALLLAFTALPHIAPAQSTTSPTATMDHSSMGHEAPLTVEGHKVGENATIKSTVTSASPLQPGQSNEMTLTLTDLTGKPVTPNDLVEMHTEKVHLLIVDPSLADYHHIHPKPSDKAGNYTFTFTPKMAGEYLFFSDLVPVVNNKQEYSIASATVTGNPLPVVKQEQRSATVNGYTFDLKFDNPELVQGESNRATLTVKGPEGTPFEKLEPVMGAFAHMVAFSEKRDHVAHVHPQGKEPESTDERGGPELTFYMNITQPGYHLLYSQVQIDGKDVFAPFGLQVAPRSIPNNVSGIFKEVDVNMVRLENVIEGGQLGQVHGLAFWIRDLLSGINKATDVPTEAIEPLAISVKRVQSYADLLDRYGDSDQAEQTKSIFNRFQEEVEKIRTTVKAPAQKKETAGTKSLNNTNCPVSKMPVGSMEPGAALVHNGIKIGLCCSGCKETFNTDPEGFLKKAQESVKK